MQEGVVVTPRRQYLDNRRCREDYEVEDAAEDTDVSVEEAQAAWAAAEEDYERS